MTVVTSWSIDRAAARLGHAARTRVACDPVRDLIGSNDVRAAYAVQARLTAERQAAGGVITGRKIGLTSAAVQAQLGVDQPDFGVLFDDMAVAERGSVPVTRFIAPRVEAEIAFVLGEDLADGAFDPSRIRTAVDHAVAAIEICDSRVADWDISIGDTVADNASAGAYVLGTQRRTLAEFEPADVHMTMRVDGVEVSSCTGAACLGGPLVALAWLARQAYELGDPLRAGQVVLSGALGPMRPVTPGAVVTADISELGSVTVTFSDDDEGSSS